MITGIAVDDEKIILEELCAMIKQTEIELVSAFQDPLEALESIKSLKPDVVFLDIEMPGLNGIEMARKIAHFDPKIQIVFVTAYEQYALKAFEVSAVHYLLKPLTQDKINEAVERVRRVLQMNEVKGDIGKPEAAFGKAGTEGRISVTDRNNIFIIKLSDIIYLKSEEGRTVLVTKKGSFMSRDGLHFWEGRLTELDFLRCHRSFIINANYIIKMIHVLGEYKEIVLDYCDVNIPISRQKIGAIKDWLGIV